MRDVGDTVANNIKKFREQMGMEQKELGDKVGVSAQAISNYENKVSSPSIDKLATIRLALNVQPSVMLGLADQFDDQRTEAEKIYSRYRQVPRHAQKTIDDMMDSLLSGQVKESADMVEENENA